MDASALVAVIAGEGDADALADRMQRAKRRLCSPVSVWEVVSALCRSYRLRAADAREQVRFFLDAGGFEMIPIGPREAELAADAYERYGKGRHPAALNMGDCFAYACAKAHGAGLLYKGNDFSKTDLA